MRRTPINRGTSQLKRKAWLRTRKPMKRTRWREKGDPTYRAKVRSLPCCARSLSQCFGRIDPHHAGWDHSKGEGKGTGIKATDSTCVPLCRRHHQQLEWLQGPFSDWDKASRRLWVTDRIEETRAAIALMEMPSDGHGSRRSGGMR